MDRRLIFTSPTDDFSVGMRDFVTTLAFYILIDVFWIGLIGKEYYHKSIRAIQKQPFNVKLWAASMVYPLMALGQTVFILPEARRTGLVSTAVLRAALFAFIVYGVFDFLNYALFNNWPIQLTLIDMTEGIILSMVVAFFTFTFHNQKPVKHYDLGADRVTNHSFRGGNAGIEQRSSISPYQKSAQPR